MKSVWYVVVRGSESDLARLREVCAASTHHTLAAEDQTGEWHLQSSTVPSELDHQAAWPKLRELLVRLTDVAAAAAEDRVRLNPGPLGKTRPDGGSDMFVFPEPARLRVRTYAPTISIGGAPVEPLATRLLRLQEANEHLRLALHFLNADLSWFNVWKAYEVIRAANGGAAGLVKKGWATADDLDRLRLTANTYAASGDAARHALPDEPSPTNPMTVETAEDSVRHLLSRWVTALSEPTEPSKS